jgi:chemotaxis protein histidine kinase CheA
MEYNRIVAVTGMPGLYEIVSSKNDGALVRSLEDGNTKFVSSRIHNLSHLESIEVYTNDENVNLVEIFQAMKADKTALPDVKDNKKLSEYFKKIFPSLDQERVYASDMKKMVKWFDTLEKNKIEYKLTEAEPEEEEEIVAEEKPAKKVAEAKEEKPKAQKPKAEPKEEATAKPKAASKTKEDTAPAKTKTASKQKEEAPAKPAAKKKES